MTCPFLKEAQVRYCGTSSIRKLVPLEQASRAAERCSSERHCDCPVFQQQPAEQASAASGACPLLHESLMQYCGGASVAKLIPYSESPHSRCGNDSHRYCELYLQMAHPLPPARTPDGIAMPEELGYSVNHLWLDVGEHGLSHIGIDGFLNRVLGDVERISFVGEQGGQHPLAVVTSAGVDLEIALPFSLPLASCNLYLRVHPERLTGDPYTRGWLFAGTPDAGSVNGLLRGDRARRWMGEEVHAVGEFLQRLPGPAGASAADGGIFSAGLARCIDREQMLTLFHEFFSPIREPEVRS